MLHRVRRGAWCGDGTRPDDDRMVGWYRRQVRLEMVREILRAWGIVVSDQALARLTEMDLTTDDAVARAALDCDEEADLLARLRRR